MPFQSRYRSKRKRFHNRRKACGRVVNIAQRQYPDGVVDVESIQDIVEKVLMKTVMPKRQRPLYYIVKRRSAREANALIGATINMFTEYLSDRDWKINENANTQKSINGLNNYVREAFTKNYWLHRDIPRGNQECPFVGRYSYT